MEDTQIVNVEFEEKEFERPLYNQLDKGTTYVWSPGQIFEKLIGIDSAIFLENPYLWRRMGYCNPLAGVLLEDYNFGYIWKVIKKRKPLPDFRLNLFIQAKRPNYKYKTPPKKVRSYISGECYKFEITNHQQKALEKLHINLRNRVLILYAAPCFSTSAELYRHTCNGTIIDSTSFVKASSMKGHSSCIYNTTIGIGCSVPEELQKINIYEEINLFIEENYGREANSSLQYLWTSIFDTLKDGDLINETTAYFINEVDELENYINRYDFEDNEMKYYILIKKFCEFYNLDWFVLG